MRTQLAWQNKPESEDDEDEEDGGEEDEEDADDEETDEEETGEEGIGEEIYQKQTVEEEEDREGHPIKVRHPENIRQQQLLLKNARVVDSLEDIFSWR